MIPVTLRDTVDKVAAKFFKTSFGRVLGTTTIAKQEGLFNCLAFTIQTTGTKIAVPDGDGSVEITDLVATFGKVATSVVQLRFNDGTNTKAIFAALLTDGPLHITHAFAGKWQGWRSAYLEVVIANADVVGAVSVGFIRHKKENSKTYNQMVEEYGW